MSDSELAPGLERYQLPLLLGGGLALYGASRFDATRPIAGVLLTYGFPVLALAFASSPLRESSLFGKALGVGVVGALAAELAIGHAMAPNVPLFALVPTGVLTAASLTALVLGAVVQAVAKSRGMRSTFAGWLGIVTALALYLPSHVRVGKDSLDAFVAALLVSLFLGGGAGLLLGGLAARFVKRPPSPSAPKAKSG
ncbi:MAG: hypothetical protein U0263_34840 [Polyangiaceae bacterium]